ncbi:LOW QUALITY PROTEIN: hypothetical protein HID58_013772 [Brassica napus]|uniref:Calmodulin-binding domain-containing protein n=1 Tax=Brassica napus TaxID=3708 RepID=A0ABQ7XHD8_BRANA|nr:LOW QUALITY PROTEIN: hypothetical protein HID58_013772 [Brassica napus]
MVQRKTTCQAIKSYNLQPETRFGPEMMMMMKRTKPKRKLKDSSVSQSDTVNTKNSRSPNYMKGTSSSEARIENKRIFNQKNQTGKKERSNNKPGSRIVRGLTKTPSFNRCSQRATCSSTLKDSKFPEYLMVNHDGTDDGEVSGTSVLRVCPYTYCSLNGHLHKQYPPFEKLRILEETEFDVSEECEKEDVVEMYVEEKKECESVDRGTFETQISETVSEGAPRSETDSDEYSDTAEIVKFSEGDDDIESQESDLEETLVQKTCEVDDDSDSAEMVRFLEGDHDIELKENVLEETMADDSVKEIEKKENIEEDMTLDEETLKDSKEESQDKTEAVPTLEETAKIPYKKKIVNKGHAPKKKSQIPPFHAIIKCKKPVAKTED